MVLKNKKEENFSEWYTELVGETGADLADIRYGIQGAIVNKPWATMIMRKFEELIEKEVEKDGHKPMLFPTIVPEKYIKAEKDHVKGFAPELYWVTNYTRGICSRYSGIGQFKCRQILSIEGSFCFSSIAPFANFLVPGISFT